MHDKKLQSGALKKICLLLIVCSLFAPLYAQRKLGPVKLSPAAERIYSGHLLKRTPMRILSDIEQENFYNQIKQEASEAFFSDSSLEKGHSSPLTLQVQHNDSPFELVASCSAINFEFEEENTGLISLSGHSARRISPHKKSPNRKPHIRVQTGPNHYIITPIETVFIGNPEGMDVSFFKVPKEVIPYLTTVRPAKHNLAPGEKVTIQGFIQNQKLEPGQEPEPARPFTLPYQTVLFTTPLKTFIQKTTAEELPASCGGLVLNENGEVAAILIGFDSSVPLNDYDWFKNLPEKTKRFIPGTLYAVPIEVMQMIVKSIQETGSGNETGIMMKVLGNPIAILHPNESIVSIEQLRNGESIAKVQGGRKSAVNPEKLELFFNLQEGDVLRVLLDSFSMEHPHPSPSFFYDIDVSTGKFARGELE